MGTTIRIVRDILLCILLICLIAFAWIGMRAGLAIEKTINAAKDTIVSIQPAVKRLEGTIQNANAVLIQVGLVASRVEDASRTWQDASERQTKYWDKITQSTGELLATAQHATESLDTTIKHADTGIEELLKTTDNTVGMVSVTLDQLAESIKDVSDKATISLDDVHNVLSDQNLRASQQEMLSVLKHTSGATENVEEATGYIRDMLSPKKKSFWMRILELMIPRPTIGLGK